MASNHSSQRSRVKGTLELYHAYISDSSSIENDNGDVSDSGGWELVQPENNMSVEQAANVCINISYFKFVAINCDNFSKNNRIFVQLYIF